MSGLSKEVSVANLFRPKGVDTPDALDHARTIERRIGQSEVLPDAPNSCDEPALCPSASMLGHPHLVSEPQCECLEHRGT